MFDHEVDCFCSDCCTWDISHSARCVGRCYHCIARHSCRACGRRVDEADTHGCSWSTAVADDACRVARVLTVVILMFFSTALFVVVLDRVVGSWG
jgi:hypothetical protein